MSEFTDRREQMLWTYNQGIISNNDAISRVSYNPDGQLYRADYCRLYLAYYDNTQYLDKVPHDYELPKWGTQSDQAPFGRPYLFKERRPRVVDTMPRLAIDRIFSMMFGGEKWPNIKAQEGLQQQLQDVMDNDPVLKQQFCAAVRKSLAGGTFIIHNTKVNGVFRPKIYDPRYSRPEFDPEYPLLCKRVAIIWDFWNQDKDKNDQKVAERGPTEGDNAERFWGRVDVDEMTEQWYKPIKYGEGALVPPENDDPKWVKEQVIAHKFGFCPVLWIRNISDNDIESIDGKSLYHGQLMNFDAINYSLSMLDKALMYSGSPQTVLAGVEEQQIDRLKGGSNKTWVIPADAKAYYLELQGKGLDRMLDHIKHMKRITGQNMRVILDDPEEIQGWAVSATAINMHLQPMYNLVDELRGIYGPYLVLYLKQYVAIMAGKTTSKAALVGPDSPKITLDWKKMQLESPDELGKIMNMLAQAAQNKILSQETITRIAARHFPISDVAAEINRLQAEVEQARKAFDEANTRANSLKAMGQNPVK